MENKTMESKADYSLLPTVEGMPMSADWRQYPGNRRIPLVNLWAGGPPPDTVLIKTAGNALQAVNRKALEEEDLIAVSVPEGLHPGDELLVAIPNGNGSVVLAVVPERALPGHTFLVKLPPASQTPVAAVGIPLEEENTTTESTNNSGTAGTTVVVGQDLGAELLLQEQTTNDIEQQRPQPEVEMTSNERANNNTNDRNGERVLIKVPPGAAPGEKIRVQIRPGQTIEATVPEGSPKEFYVRVPRQQQNWHDNPLAVAPMTVGPFLM